MKFVQQKLVRSLLLPGRAEHHLCSVSMSPKRGLAREPGMCSFLGPVTASPTPSFALDTAGLLWFQTPQSQADVILQCRGVGRRRPLGEGGRGLQPQAGQGSLCGAAPLHLPLHSPFFT